MQKTKISWADMTWNPVTGCKHGCPYCYARKIAERFKGSKAWPNGFEPAFYHERLVEPSKKKQPQTIFVCSMADLFGEWVPDLWIKQVFNECTIGYNHTYIFLTKNPARYLMMPGEYFTENRWFGATITGPADIYRISLLKQIPRGHKFISFEPLLGQLPEIDITGIEQVIIGGQTNPTVPVRFGDILPIIHAADRVGAKIFMKDNLVVTGGWSKPCKDLAWLLHKPGTPSGSTEGGQR